jgi:hypothetical protein
MDGTGIDLRRCACRHGCPDRSVGRPSHGNRHASRRLVAALSLLFACQLALADSFKVKDRDADAAADVTEACRFVAGHLFAVFDPMTFLSRFDDAALRGVSRRPMGAGCSRDDQCTTGKCEKAECVCQSDGDCSGNEKCNKPLGGINPCRP